MFGRKKPEVLVAGAGPVGLFAALMLAKRGVRVQIVDKEWRPATHSYALALHTGVLDLFKEAGLLGDVLEDAYRVRTVSFYDGAERMADLHFSEFEEGVPYLTVMRQDVLESVLVEALQREGVKVQWNHQVAQLFPGEDHVGVTIDKMEKESVGYALAHTEWIVAKSTEIEVPFVIGADGHASDVRRALGIGFPEVGPASHFAVFEFQSDADLGYEMRVVMDDATTNVLWPLPDHRCRWSFQLSDFTATEASRDKLGVHLGAARYPVLQEEYLHAMIKERAPWFDGSVNEIDWRLAVRFEHRLADRFGAGRLWLAGDAAHMTGPVGIQSMNVGLREAAELAEIITGILHGKASMERLEAYNRDRLAEWRFLLGLEGGLAPTDAATPWIRQRADRMLPCLPASGDHLAALAGQLHLDVVPATATQEA